ncbi:MAG: T9SS C-terminal target domain-containing protein [Calditrichaeota bacterium]|nr:MAG: T9SS C-terminal target domain-containing protein [Calditrichota bacterium]MBL1204648.1 T9SS C-terminal target domain-containing protein [Calditrichota bacterium]NOG44476.1 T9SS type A sorting domain-containing protein [Calditrichota bacterium]
MNGIFFLSAVRKHLSFFYFLSILVLVSAGFSKSDQGYEPGEMIVLKAADGSFTNLVAGADDDGDTIENALEISGYTYSILDGLQPWDGDSTKKYYITDPLKWSTDGDPYSDYMEVSGINMPAAISPPENHPLVAARPVIVIKLTDYDVIPLATITDTKGGEESSSFTNETSNSNTVSASVTVGAELNPFKMASVEVTASYSHTWTNTQSSTSSFGSNWSNTRTTQPDQAAKLKLRIYMENMGGATALEVTPTINLSLGKKTIATFIPSQVANILTPPGTSDSRFPKTGTIVVEKDESNNDIILTLDELRAIQMGTPLSLEVIQVSAKVVRWNPNDQDWNSDIDWASFESEIDPVSVDVRAEMGNGTNRRYQVFAGTSYWDPEFDFEDIASLIFDVEKTNDGTTIEGRKYPDDWYLSSPSPEVINEWETAGRPGNMLGLRMYKNTKLVMMSPGDDPKPAVSLASYSADYKHVLISALPNNFPILSVTAEVPVNGETKTFILKQGENSFYTNEVELESIPDGPGTVTVENARGDKISTTILLPAIYANAKDVKEFSSFLPDPGAEYWIYQNGDEDKPMLLYCIFFDPETHAELTEPREYLSIENTSGNVYSDYVAYDEFYRFNFNKIRINPSTLNVDINDKTFNESEIIVGTTIPGWIENSAQVGRVQWAYPETDSGATHIDLTGTPFHFATTVDFTLHSDATTIINNSRKKLDVTRRNLQSWDYYDYNGVATDSIQLVFDYEAVPVKNGLQELGNALHVNPSDNSGYISVGDPPALRMTNKFTIEAWIYPTGPGIDDTWGGMIINKEGEYELFRAKDGTIRWAISNTSPDWSWRSTHYNAPENQWLHIALVYDGEYIKTYFNGVLFHKYAGSGSVRSYYEEWRHFWIGGRQASNTQRFQGVIDEVRVWNLARSESQLQSTYNDTLNAAYYSTADSGLAGYWRFDEIEDLGDGVIITQDLSLNDNQGQLWGDVVITGLPTDIDDNLSKSPESYMLKQNYPNPFNPVTTIEYKLVKHTNINLSIYNMMGQKVKTLVDGRQNSGAYILKWEGLNYSGNQVASGTYIYRMIINGKSVLTRKMILIR